MSSKPTYETTFTFTVEHALRALRLVYKLPPLDDIWGVEDCGGRTFNFADKFKVKTYIMDLEKKRASKKKVTSDQSN